MLRRMQELRSDICSEASPLTWLLERKSELVSLMGAETKVGGEAESQGRRESLQGQRWSATVSNPRLSKSSSNYSVKTVTSNPGESRGSKCVRIKIK